MKLYKVLVTGYDYPPVEVNNERRYIAAGDISAFTDDDAAALLAAGRIEAYQYTSRPVHSPALNAIKALYGVKQ